MLNFYKSYLQHFRKEALIPTRLLSITTNKAMPQPEMIVYELEDATPDSEREVSAWARFVREGLVEDFDLHQSNVVHDFSKMSKRFGKSYIDYLKLTYMANMIAAENGISDEEFCKINGNVPAAFLSKLKAQKYRIITIKE